MLFEDRCNFTALNDVKIMMIFSHYHEAFKNFLHSTFYFITLYYSATRFNFFLFTILLPNWFRFCIILQDTVVLSCFV